MKVSELFPNRPTIEFNGKEYTLEYTALSEYVLTDEYGSYADYSQKSAEMAIALLQLRLDTVSPKDIVKFLVAGLLHTDLLDQFIDKSKYPWQVNAEAAKGYIATLVYRRYAAAYISAITQAFSNSMISKEMQEKLEIIAAQVEKKTQEASQNGSANTPTTPLSATEARNGSGDQPEDSE